MEFLGSLFGSSRRTAAVDRLDRSRCQISTGISKKELHAIASNGDIRTLQFCDPLTTAEIENLEQLIFSRRPDITLRVWGHHQLTCDLSFLRRMPSVERLSADCLLRATSVDTVSTLPKLEELSIGISNLDSFSFLLDVPATLTKLALHQTLSKKPSIAALGRFKSLKYLYLEGQQKGIEELSELTNLETVVLRSISTPDLDYLKNLRKLWSVDIKLGGIKRFDALATLDNLKYLELWQVLGLRDLSFISGIESLQNLFIQSQKQVTKLPSFDHSFRLRRISLENLKGLKDLSSLEFAPSLEEFCFVLAGNQKPDDMLPVLRNPSVQRVFCGLGSEKKFSQFNQLAQTYNKQQYTYTDFKYD